MNPLEILKEQKISEALIRELDKFRLEHPLEDSQNDRVAQPPIPFYGKEILEMAIAALLQGENLLLCGAKATGKNILAENLAWLFNRPMYNISFHVNTDSSTLIGTDTFKDNEVQLRKGPVYQCAQYGGFGVLDEINMAKNDAVSVLHETLDYRRMIDVPGYDRICLHPATRFIGTMNYGYAGTRELNEALVSRFLVIRMPDLTEETLMKILGTSFPDAKKEALGQFAGLFLDLQTKAANSEISTKAMDLRGLLAALKTIRGGLNPRAAITMGLTNKCFDNFERELIEDMVMTRVPESWTPGNVF
ncbi:MAG: MoxR family ATPase [Lachnospiraceae bacterium]|nr:MoxR family ATPase [Lachnospiraceae bacterium]